MDRARSWPSLGERMLATSSTTSPRRSMITRRLPGVPPSHGCCASSMPFLADVVVAGEAEDVAHDLAARIVAAVFVVVVQALDAECRDARGDFGRDRALEVDETRPRHRAAPPARPAPGRERRPARVSCGRGRLDLVRPRPDRLDRRADRERLAEPVEDASAVRRNLEVPAVARRALFLQKFVVDPLQVQRPRDEQAE